VTAFREGLLVRLATKPASLDELASEMKIDPADHDWLRAWLELGLRLRELRLDGDRYELRGYLARRLARPENDAVAAILEEVATLHHMLVLDTPRRLARHQRFALADQDGVLVARSSRLVRPFVHEAVDEVVPHRGAFRLLEVGAGSGCYIRRAAARNPALTALGLELQPEVAAMARENIRAWGLADRVTIEVGDVRARTPEPAFDLVTLHNNIYYFPVAERVACCDTRSPS
jgi:predicted O-methyltransferase YrrM